MSAPGTFFFKTGTGQPNFSVETCIRAFDPTRPYPQQPQAIIYRARFTQLRAYYSRPAQNTPHPDLPQVIFADDTDFQDRPGGIVEWTRTWTTIPNSWDNFESYAYQFPGIISSRFPISKTVTSKLTEDYFIVGTLSNFSDLLANYDDLNNASWTKSHANSTPNAAAIPACAGGASVAAKVFTDTGNNTTHAVYQASNAASGTVAAAVFAKRAEFGTVRVAVGKSDASLTFADVTVDLETGIPTINGTANYNVAAIGDGWWRIAISTNAANANAALIVSLIDNNGNSSWLGDGTSGVYLWRGQLVTGGTIPHASIPPTLTPDGTNYPIASAGFIPVKFGTCYAYNWASTTPAEFIGNGTTPNYNTYINDIAVDAANPNSYSLEALDSVLSGMAQSGIVNGDS